MQTKPTAYVVVQPNQQDVAIYQDRKVVDSYHIEEVVTPDMDGVLVKTVALALAEEARKSEGLYIAPRIAVLRVIEGGRAQKAAAVGA